MMVAPAQRLSWLGIVRLGLVQTALGAVVVLTTSTLNRVMVVELALPAMLPGLLVGVHYALQVLRPRLGHGSDVGGRRVPWIVGGMMALCGGGVLAAVATALMGEDLILGIALGFIAFVLIGIGVGAAGTSLLVLLAKRTAPARRSAAASIAWIMMIAGFIVTTAAAGHALDPFSPLRLIVISTVVSMTAMVLTLLGVWRVEAIGDEAQLSHLRPRQASSFRSDFLKIWNEPQSRRFAVFIFISMLAYSAQDLILEPFAGAVFGMTPGQTTELSSVQHTGALIGMILVPVINALMPRWRTRSTQWIVAGCVASALSLLNLAFAAFAAPSWPLRASVLLLGITNGVYAIVAIGAMMNMVGAGQENREGTRMGLWGAAQAISFGVGGFVGTVAIDAARLLLASVPLAYATVFAAEAALFIVAAQLANRIAGPTDQADYKLLHTAKQGA